MNEAVFIAQNGKRPWVFGLPNRIKVLTCLVMMFSILAIWKQGIDTLIPVSDYYVNVNEKTIGADFTAFYAASVVAADEDYRKLYSGKEFNDVRLNIFQEGGGQMMYYGYPPTALLLWAPLHNLKYTTALYLWILLGVIGIATLIYTLTKNVLLVLLGITSPYVLWGIVTGQTGLICAVILTAGFIAYRKEMHWTSGAVFGLLIFKPHLALALPFCLLASKNWKVIISGIISGSFLIGLSLFFFGVEAWAEFAANMLNNSAPQLESNSGLYKRIPTIYTTINYLVDHKTIALICHLVGAIFAISVCIYVWQKSHDFIAQLICIFVTPAFIFTYYYDYDLSCLGILLVVLVKEIFSSDKSNWQYFIPVLTWIMGMSIYLVHFNGYLLGPIFLSILMCYAIYRAKNNLIEI